MPLRILVFATEWWSAHGGLSSLNRQLCVALAGVGHQIICVVLAATEQEIAEAAARNIQLIKAPEQVGYQEEERLILYSQSAAPEFKPDLIIGHDHKTGPQAFHAAKRVYDNLPFIFVLHTIPEETELHKSRTGTSVRSAAEKSKIQMDLCKRAQLVVAVGPRIYRHFQNRFMTPLFELRPGLDARLLQQVVDLTTPRAPWCLLFGRMEDADLKGAELACHTIRKLNEKWGWPPVSRPKLIIRGFSADFPSSEYAPLIKFKDHVLYRQYSSDAEEIIGDINSASVVIMPSKREGFGLVALEAVAAGVPIIVSSESGFALLLYSPDIYKILGKDLVDLCVAEVDGEDSDAICADWAAKLRIVLDKSKDAFIRAEEMRNKLKSILTWENAAKQMSEKIREVIA